MRIFRLFLPILFLIILILVFTNCKLISYGLNQGYGQLKMLSETEKIEDILNNPQINDTLKQKLKLVAEIKKFAIDSLGINPTENYETFYDQKGKPILWIVVASEKYRIKPYLWQFPIIGKVPYKGYFDKKDAVKESEKISELAYDTRVGTVSAWSSLGYFKDPVLSSMLDDTEGELAQLLIHELTHGTLYVNSNSQFNENLATFVGNHGAEYYLISKYGKNSPQYKEYLNILSDETKYANHIMHGVKLLDSLYQTFKETEKETTKDSLKRLYINNIILNADTLSCSDKTLIKNILSKKDKINNAYFVSYKTYHNDISIFEKEFREKYNSEFRVYLAFLKEKYKK